MNITAAAAIMAAAQHINRASGIDWLDYHEAQRLVITESKRFNVVDCGRRWGKTLLGIDLCLLTASGGFPVGWFAPNYKYLTEAWRDMKRRAHGAIQRKSETEKRIELSSGGVVEFWTMDDPDAGRSRAYKRVIIDEAAKVAKLKEAWEESVRATLSDYRGDAWFLSTPKGRNYFYILYNRGLGGERDWAAWQMPTSTNPFIDPDEIEDARYHLPREAFAQEYLAEFLDDAGLVFRGVRDCLWTPYKEPQPGHRYVMGVDWGQSQDFTALFVMDASLRKVVEIDRFNRIGWGVQRGRLAAMASRWGVSRILAEENSIGGPNIEQLQSEGLPVEAFTTTSQTKQDIVVALQLAFERQDISIPDDPVLIGELESFEATRLPSGKWRYEAPDGMHDDTVIALALANWECGQTFINAGEVVNAQPHRFSSSPY